MIYLRGTGGTPLMRGIHHSSTYRMINWELPSPSFESDWCFIESPGECKQRDTGDMKWYDVPPNQMTDFRTATDNQPSDKQTVLSGILFSFVEIKGES